MHVQGCLILNQVGLLFPANHAPEIGVPDRLRSRYALGASTAQAGDLLHERQACCLDYTTGTNGEGRRIRAFDLMPVTRPLC